MRKEGTLEGASMAGTFDILRANDLIFNYVVSNWLMGQKPPAFDILAWNADSTRMPAAMHAFYLRNFYVENKLAGGHTGDRRTHDRPRRDQVADLRRQRDQRPHRAVGVGLQDGGSGQRAGPVRAGQRRPHRRHRQPARAEGLAHGRRRERRCRPRGVARGRRARVRLLVGGLGGLVGRALGPDGRPAADGQRRPPGARRRAGELRAAPEGTQLPAETTSAGAGVSIAASAPRRGCGLSGELAGEAARGDGERGQHRLQAGAEVAHGELDARPPTSPPGPKTGIATPQAPASSSKRVTATRVSRVTASARRKRSGEVTVCAVYGRSPRMIVMSTTPGGEKASRARPSAVGWAGSVAAGLNDGDRAGGRAASRCRRPRAPAARPAGPGSGWRRRGPPARRARAPGAWGCGRGSRHHAQRQARRGRARPACAPAAATR